MKKFFYCSLILLSIMAMYAGVSWGACSHTYTSYTTTIKPTCQRTGSKYRTCTKCKTIDRRDIAKVSCSGTNFKITRSATCTLAGVKTGTCKWCKGTVKLSISKASHDYSTTWLKDASNHWQKCKNCSATRSKASHSYSSGKCSTCGYTKPSTTTCSHPASSLSTTWHNDTTNHWKVCSSCKKNVNTAPHNWGSYTNLGNGNHSAKCSVCPRTKTEAHSYNTSGKCTCGATKTTTCSHPVSSLSTTWHNDTTNHWKVCSSCKKNVNTAPHNWGSYTDLGNGSHSAKCSVCPRTKTEAHSYNTSGKCTCGATKTTTCSHPASSLSTTWHNDTTNHWKVCSSCKNNANVAPHNWGSYTDLGNGNHSAKCGVCPRTKTEAHSYNTSGKCTCGATKTTTCTHPVSSLSTTWHNDTTNHWKVCSSCKNNANVAPHNWGSYTDLGNGNHSAKCSVCPRTKTEAHSYNSSGVCTCGARRTTTCTHPVSSLSTIWHNDTTNHWKVCSSCKNNANVAPHNWGSYTNLGNGSHSAKCSVCPRTKTETHTYNSAGLCSNCGARRTTTCTHPVSSLSTIWHNDTTNHWKVCSSCKNNANVAPHNWGSYTDLGNGNHSAKCSVCPRTKTETHTYNSAGLCSNCGARRTTTCTHPVSSLSTIWHNDTTNHWKVCSTCKNNANVAPHNWGSYTDLGNGNHSAKCSVCPRTKTETHTYNSAGLCSNCGARRTTTCTHPVSSLSTIWHNDTTNHWKVCSTCKNNANIAPHNWGSYTDLGNGNHSAKCSVCPRTKTEAHSYNSSGVCTCGARRTTTCTHPVSSLSTIWHNDTTNHWKVCSTCKNNANIAPHNWGSYTDLGNGNHSAKCSVCPRTKTETHSYDSSGVCTCGARSSTTACTYHSNFVISWNADSTTGISHSHTVKCGVCNYITYRGPHTLDANGECTYKVGSAECNYSEINPSSSTTCNHSYLTIWTKDDNYHWKVCELCGYINNKDGHTYSNGVCTICSYKHEHQPSSLSTWKKGDAINHWKECGICKAKVSVSLHQFDSSGICKVCGRSKCQHPVSSLSTMWYNDLDEHWKICSTCKEKANIAPHNWKYIDVENGTHLRQCQVCPRGITEKHTFKNGKCVCGATETIGGAIIGGITPTVTVPTPPAPEPIPSGEELPIPDHSGDGVIQSGISFALYYGTTKIEPESTTEVPNTGEIFEIRTDATETVKIFYTWDDAETGFEFEGVYGYLAVPGEYEIGSTHKLSITIEGNPAKFKHYNIKIVEKPVEEIVTTPVQVLDWEKNNLKLDTVAISLRNDSTSGKLNKNVYALNEAVTYYIDYANGGEDITEPVEIQLELPLKNNIILIDNFEVINGKVDIENVEINNSGKVITWKFPEGMKKGQSSTLTVLVQYTAFSKSGVDGQTIYPLASIVEGKTTLDKSAVINYIYRDGNTLIEEVHKPYMRGDANSPTFRPDATITRAEGALVLARIMFGQETIDRTEIGSTFPDIGQTYEEAQRAITVATTYGLINGFTDGTYRPGESMTRAEFMKILASYIELNASEDGIEGLNIKEINKNVKLYKDPRYAVDAIVDEHWAIEEITLLARLNMLPLSSANTDLRMDEKITRAEVAQLVNFFLVRAPQIVSDGAEVGFEDVSIDHLLVRDIVEATKPAHNFYIFMDGTEYGMIKEGE